jgi:hypothetical protein
MSFSHAGDFNQIFLFTIDIKIFQPEGQGRTAPISKISLPKEALAKIHLRLVAQAFQPVHMRVEGRCNNNDLSFPRYSL